jgi:uncharacterized integral membrane protein
MSGPRLPDPESDAPEEPQHRVTGAWVGYLIFALILLFLLVLAAQAAYEHEWAYFAWVCVSTLTFFIVPTGGLKWLRRIAQSRKASTRSGYRG